MVEERIGCGNEPGHVDDALDPVRLHDARDGAETVQRSACGTRGGQFDGDLRGNLPRGHQLACHEGELARDEHQVARTLRRHVGSHGRHHRRHLVSSGYEPVSPRRHSHPRA